MGLWCKKKRHDASPKDRGTLNHRGQVTIFIILAIIIVVVIILMFTFPNRFQISAWSKTDPVQFIGKCAQENIQPMIESVIATGGVYYSGSNNDSFLDTNSSRFAILCITNISRMSCINTHPLIAEEVKYNIKKVLTPKIDLCFKKLKDNYPNAEISEENLEFDVDLVKDAVSIKIRKPLYITTNKDSVSFDTFDFNINSMIYDFLELSNIIVNTESSCDCTKRAIVSGDSSGAIIYMPPNGTSNPFLVSKPNANCDVDLLQMDKSYPDYVFTRNTIDNGVKIYTITSLRIPQQSFSFVVKNCISGCGGPDSLCYHHYHKGDIVHYSSTIKGCHNQIHHYHDTEEYIID